MSRPGGRPEESPAGRSGERPRRRLAEARRYDEDSDIWSDPLLRDRRFWMVVLLLVVATVGHVVFWYLPRARPALPADGRCASLLEHPTLPLSVWIPFPHQNLGMLEKSLGVEIAGLRGALEAADLPNPDLPRFGNLKVPPSKALAMATDLKGERFMVAADIYPAVAIFSRLAGHLAGNTWLAGGDLVRKDQRLRVQWFGNVWTVVTHGTPSSWEGDDRWTLDAGPPAFSERLPYLVARATEAPRSWAESMARAEALLLAVSVGPSPLGAAGQAMVLIGQDSEATSELPRGAVLHRVGVDRWDLPAELVLKVAGREAETRSTEWLDVASTEPSGFAAAELLAPEVADMLVSRHRGGPTFGLWLEMAPMAEEVTRMRRGLEGAPLLPSRLKGRWRGAEAFLHGLSGSWQRMSLTVGEAPPALWLRVEAREQAETADGP